MDSLPELLPIYYKKLFPYTLYCKWLKYDEPDSYFKNRELSFTLKNDIYLRYRSYSDQQEFEKDMKAKCPYKIDVGAVYSCSPKMRDMVRAGEFVAQYKELVFDIDMTDYDDVRLCCSGASICPKCWPLMTIAVQIVDKALAEDFGFRHRLWVYSGRRGVHCWVADSRARKLDTSNRSAIAEYLTLVKGGANSKKKVRWGNDLKHHSVKRAIGILEKYFKEYILSQGFLDSQQGLQTIIDILDLKPDSRALLVESMDGVESAIGRFEILHEALKLDPGSYKLDPGHAWDEFMIQYTYPRLDANVSKGVNHLLKSPFCIHPKTGRVCVPIDVNHVDEFDPFKVPTLEQLTEELSSYSGETNLLDYKKTSLKEYIRTFESFVAEVAPPTSRKKVGDDDKENAPMDMSF